MTQTARRSFNVEVLHQYGSRLGLDTLVYSSGSGAFLLVSLLTLTVFTHYMPPSEYGELSILFVSAGVLTILLNLIPLAGVLRWVWVAGEADSGAVDDPSRQAPGGTKRRALGTGTWMSLACIALGCGALVPFAKPLARLLIGSSSASGLVLLTIASGAAGALFRLTSNVVRMERRPVSFSMLVAVRPAIALAVAIPLLASGDGIAAALIGTSAGSLACTLAAFVIARRSYSAQFAWVDVRGITDLGFKYTLVIVGLYIVHNGDALVMSRFTTHAAVGVYRVAARLAAVLSYLVAAFLQAWAPLERSALFQATYDAHGAARVHTKMVTYFVLAALAVVLGLGLCADVLVRLAPGSYRGAAPLVPFAACMFLVYGVFVLLARTTYHGRRDLVHNLSAGLAAIVFIVGAAMLVPLWGGYGLAVAGVVAMALACAWFRAIVPSSTHHAELEWRRLLPAGALTAGCLTLGLAPATDGAARAALDVADFFFVFPVGLLLTGAVPAEEARLLAAIARAAFAELLVPLRGGRHPGELAAALTALDPGDVALLESVTRGRVTTVALAARSRMPVSVVESRAGHALRALGGVPGDARYDAALGHWLFSGQGSAERDFVMHFLIERGLALETLHGVESTAASLRKLPARFWPAHASHALAEPQTQRQNLALEVA
jgi:O-antigen/teichoic acid export membrane protein